MIKKSSKGGRPNKTLRKHQFGRSNFKSCEIVDGVPGLKFDPSH